MKNLEKAFSFPFKDPGWLSKFLLAFLFMLLGLFVVGIFIVTGYFIQVTQRVMRQQENTMPEWTDIGVMLITGFKFCVVYFIYALPILILYIPFLVLFGIGQFVNSGGDLAAFAEISLATVIFLFILPYSLVLALLFPIVVYRFAERERISDALDIGGVLKEFKRNWQGTAIVALIGAGLSALSAVGIVFLLVGVLVTIFYTYLVMSYMCGLLYLEQKEKALE